MLRPVLLILLESSIKLLLPIYDDIMLYFGAFLQIFTRLRSRKVVMCLVVVYVCLFVLRPSFPPLYNCEYLTYFDQTRNIEDNTKKVLGYITLSDSPGQIFN